MKPDPVKPRRALVEDPELAAMNRISRALNALDQAGRERVLSWIASRYAAPKDTKEQR